MHWLFKNVMISRNGERFWVEILRRTRNKLYVKVINYVMHQPFHYNDEIVIDKDEVLGLHHISLRSCLEPFPFAGASCDHGFAKMRGYKVGDVVMVSDGKGSEVGMKIIRLTTPWIIGTREFVNDEIHIESSYPDIERLYYSFSWRDIIATVR